jgi:hypothetical protein
LSAAPAAERATTSVGIIIASYVIWLKLESNHPAKSFFICMNVMNESCMNACCMNVTIYNISPKR